MDLVSQNTECPPINGLVVFLPQDNLRCEVVNCPTESFTLLTLAQHPGEAQVHDLDVASLVNHNIFQLEVSVDQPQAVEIFQAQENLAQVEANSLHIKRSQVTVELVEEIGAFHVLHHQTQLGPGLEVGLVPDDEWKVDGSQYPSLRDAVMRHRGFQNSLLLNDLQGKLFACSFDMRIRHLRND